MSFDVAPRGPSRTRGSDAISRIFTPPPSPQSDNPPGPSGRALWRREGSRAHFDFRGECRQRAF